MSQRERTLRSCSRTVLVRADDKYYRHSLYRAPPGQLTGSPISHASGSADSSAPPGTQSHDLCRVFSRGKTLSSGHQKQQGRTVLRFSDHTAGVYSLVAGLGSVANSQFQPLMMHSDPSSGQASVSLLRHPGLERPDPHKDAEWRLATRRATDNVDYCTQSRWRKNCLHRAATALFIHPPP
jgi:hypothetical protein